MARQNHGPLSRAKGKLGGVVYQQYEGMQIAREYQPVVKNPQTTKQTENRAKFKLSSQIVAQFSKVFSTRLSMFSIYERMRRAASVNAIFGAINSTVPSTPTALVSAVMNAINAKSVSALAAPGIETGSTSNTVDIYAINGDTVCVQLANYNATSGELISGYSEVYTSTGSAKHIEYANGARVIVMAVGYHALTEAGRATISNAVSNENGWQNRIARAVSAGDVEVTNLNAYLVEP